MLSASRSIRVLRLCSVFEPPEQCMHGPAARFDPVGGMQTHTGELTRALDQLGVAQLVVTTRPPGAPSRARLGQHGTVLRVGLRGVIAGDGRDAEALRRRAAGLPVQFVGQCRLVPSLLRALDVLCLPSRAEALSLALLEDRKSVV